MKISVYIIAFNEADKIRDCINSVLWADEIIVADSNSTDGTTEIAESLGAKVDTDFAGNVIAFYEGNKQNLKPTV